MGKIINGEIDVGATNLLQTYARSLAVDLTMFFDSRNDASAFLCPFPTVNHGNSISGILKPFQFQVWIYAILAILICPVFLRFMAWVKFPNSTENREPMSVTDTFWFVLRTLINAHDNLSMSFNLAGKLLAAVWCLIAVVLINAYTGCVTSYIMAPTLVPFADSAKDIAAMAPRPILLTDKFSALEASFTDGASAVALKIGDTIRAHPENRLQVGSSFDGIPENVNSNGGRCYAQAFATLQVIMANDVKKTGRCRLYIAREQWPAGRRCIALSKNNPLTRIFDREIIWVRQIGLMEAWHRRFWPRPHKCSNPMDGKGLKIDGQAFKGMSLKQLGGAFMVFGIGVGTSLFAFLCELIFSYLKC